VLQQGSWLDYGLFLPGSIMVRGRAGGLDTCPQGGVPTHLPPRDRGVSSSNCPPASEMVVMRHVDGRGGSATAIENTLVTEREACGTVRTPVSD
jgi:hypothetical protein